ncbi:hypothetical protein BCF11_0448 [Collimonas sp. PA-H2]|uniref:hypothetical protein n=1 Tax=Collimonas sp. PA-H2 TaxID=1881062 RepID=UPI000C0032F6|nr:hypothetical protein [Collimonas sp. PA-H2]PFH08096.1 hypothetical protein BCF11_0448 [Collimonas sp. PA-H2]
MLELKEAFGRYMGRYYASLTPTTRAMKSFAERGISKSIVWAPDRMIDQVQDMLAAWRKNDNDGGPGSSAHLPVMIVATGKDYSPVLGDFSRQVPEPEWVTLPGDPLNRLFQLRQMQGERRAQIVICAAEDETARSMAAQFTLFIAAVVNRRFDATYRFAGINHQWPVMLEATDVPAMNIDSGQKNLTILAIDLTLKETIPLFSGPKSGEQNDGKGDGSADNPHGYPAVGKVISHDLVQNVHSHVADGAPDVPWHQGVPEL